MPTAFGETLALRPRPARIAKAEQTSATPTSPPFTHRRHARVEFFGDRLSALPEAKAQDNAEPERLPAANSSRALLISAQLAFLVCHSRLQDVGAGMRSAEEPERKIR